MIDSIDSKKPFQKVSIIEVMEILVLPLEESL